MENFLRSKEYWQVVESGIAAAADEGNLTSEQQKTLADQRLKDLRAKTYLFQVIDRSILETILDKETSKGIWDSMKKKFQGNTRVKRAQLQALRKEFEILHMKDGENVSDYFSRTLTITNKLRFLGEEMKEITVIEKILRSMISKFDYVVCSIEESKDLYTMSIDELQSSLVVHEQRMHSHVVEDQALKTTHDYNQVKTGRSSSYLRGRGRNSGRQSFGGRQGFDKSVVECYYCHNLGHFQYECPRKSRNRGSQSQSQAYYAETDEPLLLMACIEDEEIMKSRHFMDENELMLLMACVDDAKEIEFFDSLLENTDHMPTDAHCFEEKCADGKSYEIVENCADEGNCAVEMSCDEGNGAVEMSCADEEECENASKLHSNTPNLEIADEKEFLEIPDETEPNGRPVQCCLPSGRPVHKLEGVEISTELNEGKNNIKGAKLDFDEIKITKNTMQMLLMAHIEKAHDETTWFLDSGCSNHMSGHKNFFLELDENFHRSVKLGDNSSIDVLGKGRIHLQVNNSSQVISEVFYIPDLKNNLLSIGQLQEKGLAILFKNNKCKVFHPDRGLIIETEMAMNRMFIVIAKIQFPDHHCFITPAQNLEYLWHCRYGHLSFGGLQTLLQKGMVHGLPQSKYSNMICEDCILGKHHRNSFPRTTTWRASQPLELLHADLCGPISPISNSHKRYLFTVIDDFSRKLWVFFLTDKSEAFKQFKLFKTRVEKETRINIKGLRTDRGGEFTSKEFAEFCELHGIKRQLTAAYTPQQNGVAERKNRTIMNMVRSLLNSRKVPKIFWPEAVNWAVHVLNRSPTFAVRNKTPEEAWSGTKPSVAHFRVFGCVSYAHIPDNKRTKLDDKSLKCVLLGVSEGAKAYRLYDPETQRIIVSRDVVFKEEESWPWSAEYMDAIQASIEWGDLDE